MSKRRRKKPNKRALWNKRLTPDEDNAQTDAAFAAIRQMYCESLPLWTACSRGFCRRHKSCSGDMKACIKRGWPLMSPQARKRAYDLVQTGGPHRRRPATAIEQELWHFPPTNFNH
jgi:hypothetical protein